MRSRSAFSLLKETYTKWSADQAPRLGASVAFYSVLSFAPLLVLLTGVIAMIFGHESAEAALVNQAREFMGDRGADTVQSLLKNAQKPASGIIGSVIAFATLLFGASGVFNELQDALNLIWDAPPETSSGLWGLVKQRLFSFGMVLSVGFLLLVSLILSSWLAFLGKVFGQFLPFPEPVLVAVNFALSFVVISALFALMFKYVPNARVPWRNAIAGALGTSFLFTVGKFLLGLYLGKASIGSTYGAAGSLVAVIVWIYYSAQIFFFGAEFTHVYSGSETGQSVTEKEEAQEKGPATSPMEPDTARETANATPPIRSHPGTMSSPVPPPSATVSLPKPTRLQHSFESTSERIHVTKPKLLLALTLGFLLGKLSPATARERKG
ncbi:MAG: YihY/virulence factor BrkB family protein [Acidobacteriaceae bacterium]|nr:YihY/virulence factor BrkB family protein [Acidobacteriaceae bacterium]